MTTRRASLFLALAVSFLWIGSSFSQEDSTATAASAEEIVFMGYNLKNYLKMKRRVDGESKEDTPKPEREVEGIVTMILKGKPDAVGLVEIGTMNEVQDLQSRLEAKGLDLPHAEIIRAYDDVRRIALISKFPIVSTNHQTALGYQLDEQRFQFRRGIFDATIQVNPDYQLRVLGVHLKSKRPVDEADQALMRRNEAHLLRKHTEAIMRAAPETNLIVFGDFNDTRNEIPIKAIQGKYGTAGYLKDIQAADDLGYKWTYCWSYADQYSRFDFLFANKPLVKEIDRDRSFVVADPVWFTASDHRPVVTTIVAKDQ
ncbi:endonuclease/exonuclease/phosphatase family protein [Verrucomicrobiales bacterium]|nr:endonuclease/exonuclease/phosphatase family protein [Verrucomicrobiales bacterium]